MKKKGLPKTLLTILLTIIFIISFWLIIILLMPIMDLYSGMTYYIPSSLLIGSGALLLNFIVFYILLNILTKGVKKKDAFNIKTFFYTIFIIPLLLNIYIPLINYEDSPVLYNLLFYVIIYAVVIVVYNTIINNKIKKLKK